MPETTLDCMGEACPVPLIRAQRAFAALAPGDVLIVQIDHSCAMKNIPEWAARAGHPCDVEEIDAGQWEIAIAKAR
jgi:TusA-related sulfurtransferase